MPLVIQPDEDGDLYCLSPYVFYTGGDTIQLDGTFTLDELLRLALHIQQTINRELQQATGS